MSKTLVKNHTFFLKKSRQIRVELHRYKWKKFLVSWKWSELVDEKKNWEQFADLWILYDTGYDGGGGGGGGVHRKFRLVVVPYPQVYEWLTKIAWSNEIGYCQINLYFHYIPCDVS